MKSQKKYDVAVIGGGHNGLTCAYYLAGAANKKCFVFTNTFAN
jgi:thioredoxin reductase